MGRRPTIEQIRGDMERAEIAHALRKASSDELAPILTESVVQLLVKSHIDLRDRVEVLERRARIRVVEDVERA
jgi:hypothetical protein